jgi:hypothetical protein
LSDQLPDCEWCASIPSSNKNKMVNCFAPRRIGSRRISSGLAHFSSGNYGINKS